MSSDCPCFTIITTKWILIKYDSGAYTISCHANFKFTLHHSLIIPILHDTTINVTFLTIIGISIYIWDKDLINICNFHYVSKWWKFNETPCNNKVIKTAKHVLHLLIYLSTLKNFACKFLCTLCQFSFITLLLTWYDCWHWTHFSFLSFYYWYYYVAH
jgi:hypothetical protein